MRRNRQRPLYLSQLKFEPLVKPKLLNSEDPELTEQVRVAISGLDPVDAQIVRGRFGIEAVPESLDALGRQLGISKQAVGKREKLALLRLRPVLAPVMSKR